MKKILVTGAMGQLGKAVNRVIAESNEDYIVENYDIIEINDQIIGNVKKLDITDSVEVDIVINRYKPDVIINCAAYTAVDLCEVNKDIAYQVNVLGAKFIAESADKISAKMVHISTDYIFDGKRDIPYTEKMKGNPQSFYAYTKYESEKEVINCCKKNFVIRTAWIYGEGKNFVNTMLKLSEDNSIIKVVNDQIGTPTSAKSVARLIMYLIKSNNYGVYHGTCEGYTSWYKFAKEIFRLSGKKVEVRAISTQEFHADANRPPYSVLENEKLKKETNFRFSDWRAELKLFMEEENLICSEFKKKENFLITVLMEQLPLEDKGNKVGKYEDFEVEIITNDKEKACKNFASRIDINNINCSDSKIKIFLKYGLLTDQSGYCHKFEIDKEILLKTNVF